MDRRRIQVGSNENFWLHSTIDGFDLTHPPTPESPPIYPRVALETVTSKVEIDPGKTALVIVDMQNFFLNPALGRPEDSKGLRACDMLLKYAIPASRKAGISIIWLNWGLTLQELQEMPPSTLKAFGFSPNPSLVGQRNIQGISGDGDAESTPKVQVPVGKDPRLYKGLGSDLGQVRLGDGETVEGGRLLMRDQWNSALFPSLEQARRPDEDTWIHKNRMSGLWGSATLLSEYLKSKKIRTLLFSGVNTDQCVAGTLQDAFSKGYDCLLLSDGCGTTTEHGQASCEENAAKTWGFCLTCKDLEDGVRNMATS